MVSRFLLLALSLCAGGTAWKAQKRHLTEALVASSEGALFSDISRSVKGFLGKGAGTDSDMLREAQAAMASGPSTASPSRASAPPSVSGMPDRARKADVVFEVKQVEDIQALVLETKVPVVLDIYADWCGPCKALAPALEETAINAGGLFRVVKVNSDKFQHISKLLKVKGLPSVFGFVDGEIVDKFEGLPQPPVLQKFLTELVGRKTNAGRVAELRPLSEKFAVEMALSSYPYSKQEKLAAQISEEMDALVPPASEETDGAGEMNLSLKEVERISAMTKVLAAYMRNAAKHRKNPKYTVLNTTSRAFSEKVSPFPAALRVLKLVGFITDPSNRAFLKLTGKNVAPLVIGDRALRRWSDALETRTQFLKRAAQRKAAEERRRQAQEAEDLFAEESDEEEDANVTQKVVCDERTGICALPDRQTSSSVEKEKEEWDESEFERPEPLYTAHGTDSRESEPSDSDSNLEEGGGGTMRTTIISQQRQRGCKRSQRVGGRGRSWVSRGLVVRPRLFILQDFCLKKTVRETATLGVTRLSWRFLLIPPKRGKRSQKRARGQRQRKETNREAETRKRVCDSVRGRRMFESLK